MGFSREMRQTEGPAGQTAGFRRQLVIGAFGLVASIVSSLLFMWWAPSTAGAVPPGPWVTPAVDLSASGKIASYPQIAFAPDGTATALWRLSGISDSTIQAATRPPGGNFGAPVDLSVPGQHLALPQIAVASDGTATAAWSRYDGSNFMVQAATRPPGGNFGAPVDISVPGQDAEEPGIAVAPDGSVTVIWRRWNGFHNIVQASTRPPGGSFAAPVDLSAPGGNAYRPRVASGPDGTATGVWYRDGGSNWMIQAATRPPGGSFAAPVDISAPGQNAFRPSIEFAPDGSATATWYRDNGSNFIVQAAARPAGGNFATAVNLSAPGGNATNSVIAIARDGTAIVVWFRDNGSNFIVQSATRPPGGSFAATTDLSAPGQSATNPQVAFAADGTATAVWRRSNGSNTVIQASTRLPGGSFGTAADLSAPGSDADRPQIGFAPDGTGIGTVVWDYGSGSNVVIQSASTTTPQLLLGVSKPGRGQGTVTSNVGGINCGVVCAVNLAAYAEVTLTATPARGSRFTGWSGGSCSGTAAICKVRMDDARNVTAGFATLQPTDGTAVFDGKRLHVRLKCGPQYRPSCNMTAAPVTSKGRKGQPMAKATKRKIRSGKWVKVSFLITPKYRAKVMAMSHKTSKQLYVQQKIRSKKIGKQKSKGKKPRIVYHRYLVRSSG